MFSRHAAFPRHFVLSRLVVAALFALVATSCASNAAMPSDVPQDLPLVDPGDRVADGEPDGPEPSDFQTLPLNVLRVGTTGTLAMDPSQASLVNAPEMMLADLLYDGLTVWHDELDIWGLGVAAEVSGNADSTLWTFTIAEDRTFSDGSPLVAADVEASIEAALADRTTVAALRLDMIMGMDTTNPDLAGVRATDPATLEIELTRPFGGLPGALSSPVFGVVPQADRSGRVTSGPMVLTSAEDSVVVLSPAPDARSSVVAEFRSYVTETDLLAAMDSGEVNVAFAESGDAASAWPRNVQVHYGVNMQNWKLRDLAVRQAVAAAIDRDAIVADVYDSGAQAMVSFDEPCDGPCGANPELAEDALAEAFNGGEVPLLYVDYIESVDPTEQLLAETIAAQLVAAGLPAEARGHSLSEFLELVANGEHEIYRAGWTGLFPSSDSLLSPYIPGSPDNVSGYDSDEFAQFMTAARRLFDGSALFSQAQRVLEEDVVVLPLVTLQHNVLVANNVFDFNLAADGSLDLAALTIY